MPQNFDFTSLRFPQNLATDEVPNYIRFEPKTVSYGGTVGSGNPVARGPGSAINPQIAGAPGTTNPFNQLRDQIGGAVDSFATGATEAISAISDVFNSASLTTSLSNLGRIVSGRVQLGDFAINFGQETRADELIGHGSINLFLPEQLQTTSSVDYAAEELGALGNAAIGLARQSNDFDIASGLERLGAASLNQALAAGGTVSAVNAISRGQVANNFSFQIFNGVGHRSFNYTFRMVAKNETESQEIKRICDMFLFYMLPRRDVQGSGESALHFYEVPAQWSIEYRRVGGLLEYHQQPRACFLQSVDVSYGGDTTYNLYQDGAPMEVTLALEFVEIEPLYRSDQIDSFSRSN